MTKIDGHTMPWAGVVDLIVTKMFAAPIRADKEKQKTDLSDLAALLAHAKKFPADAAYTERQREWVKTELHEALFKDVKAELEVVFKL